MVVNKNFNIISRITDELRQTYKTESNKINRYTTVLTR